MEMVSKEHMHFCFFLLIHSFIPSISAVLQSGLGSDDEVRLVQKLFLEDGYNPLIRPVKNLNDTVTVKFGMAMIQLINVDEKNQIMKSNVWLRMIWTDYQLQWDPTDYGGITTIRTLPDKVWKPDIVLFNNADGKYEVSYKPNVVIFHYGSILWIPPAIYKSSCTIDVKYFPFDQQRCEMKFGSWTFNGDQVVLDWYEGQDQVDLSDYVSSGTWDIIKCPGEYNHTYDLVEKHSKAQITFFLYIRRKTLFYTVNLIIPCVLISFLSVCVFYLPADAGEKMTMCISILLALVVFLLLVCKILPPTSLTIPLIAKYLLFTFIMNIVTILITVIIINWNFKTPRTHSMPKWIRIVFLNYLPKLLFMKRPHHEERWFKKTYSRRNRLSHFPDPRLLSQQVDATSSRLLNPSVVLQPATRAGERGFTGPIKHTISQSTLGLHNLYDSQELSCHFVEDLPHSPQASVRRNELRSSCLTNNMVGGNVRGKASEMLSAGSSSQMYAQKNFYSRGEAVYHGASLDRNMRQDVPSPGFNMTAETQKAIDAVRFIAAHLKNEDDYAEILEDWRYIAMVIDRLQLYTFVAVTIGGTVGILINAPHIFEFVDQEEIKKSIIGSTVR